VVKKPDKRGATVPKTLELGPCKQCGKQVVVAIQKGVPLSLYQVEEFCSSVCAKTFHGVELTSPSEPRRRTMIESKEKK
jgi:hypothetical protein